LLKNTFLRRRTRRSFKKPFLGKSGGGEHSRTRGEIELWLLLSFEELISSFLIKLLP
jgi:hypothetical protein